MIVSALSLFVAAGFIFHQAQRRLVAAMLFKDAFCFLLQSSRDVDAYLCLRVHRGRIKYAVRRFRRIVAGYVVAFEQALDYGSFNAGPCRSDDDWRCFVHSTQILAEPSVCGMMPQTLPCSS